MEKKRLCRAVLVSDLETDASYCIDLPRIEPLPLVFANFGGFVLEPKEDFDMSGASSAGNAKQSEVVVEVATPTDEFMESFLVRNPDSMADT